MEVRRDQRQRSAEESKPVQDTACNVKQVGGKAESREEALPGMATGNQEWKGAKEGE